jgi:hypothetical protein|tara:strand:- start:739 stop:906 length:168 start_codon:yes stop_codon:yes gene_type:complete
MKRFKVLTTAEMLTRYIVEAEDKEQVEKNLFDLKILSNEVLDSGEEVIYSVEEIQ